MKYKTCSNGHARPMGESERVKNKNVQGKSTVVYSCCNVGGLGRAYLNASKYVQKWTRHKLAKLRRCDSQINFEKYSRRVQGLQWKSESVSDQRTNGFTGAGARNAIASKNATDVWKCWLTSTRVNPASLTHSTMMGLMPPGATKLNWASSWRCWWWQWCRWWWIVRGKVLYFFR